MLVALPEIDGATNPTVFAGAHGERLHRLRTQLPRQWAIKAMAPCSETDRALARKGRTSCDLAPLKRMQERPWALCCSVFHQMRARWDVRRTLRV